MGRRSDYNYRKRKWEAEKTLAFPHGIAGTEYYPGRKEMRLER